MLRLSHAHLCSEHLAECNFIKFMAEYQSLMGFASKPKPWNKRQQDKDKKPNTNSNGRKGRERKRLYTNACGKERKNRPQMPVAKKERPNHKCW